MVYGCGDFTFPTPPSPIAFLLQLQDVQYMVEKFWGSQSALSACEDLYDLVMVRWDKYHEWAPWNTVLLTKDEAEAHLKLSNLEKVQIVMYFFFNVFFFFNVQTLSNVVRFDN